MVKKFRVGEKVLIKRLPKDFGFILTKKSKGGRIVSLSNNQKIIVKEDQLKKFKEMSKRKRKIERIVRRSKERTIKVKRLRKRVADLTRSKRRRK